MKQLDLGSMASLKSVRLEFVVPEMLVFPRSCELHILLCKLIDTEAAVWQGCLVNLQSVSLRTWNCILVYCHLPKGIFEWLAQP